MYDVAVIGAGVIGGLTARELTKYKLSVVLLEKESDVACGASKANSGIIHGGFDPEPDTLKAKLNSTGVDKLYKTAQMLHVPHKNNGSFVCAFSKKEEAHLKELYDRGIENGIEKMSIISGDEARAIEPNLSPEITAVLNVPTAGIICPYELTIAAVGNAMKNGAVLLTDFTVTSIINDGCFNVSSADGRCVKARYVINCAGCYGDKIAAMVGDDSFEIIPRAGQYILLDKKEGARVSHTIFQVPSKEGKGILVSPTVDGNLLTGPTAEAVDCPMCVNTTPEGLETVQRLAAKSVPSVQFREVITSFCGVRSSEKNGDFIIEESKAQKGFINVAAIDSPGLTSSVAIAEYTVEVLKNAGLELELNPDFDGTREDPHFFRHLTDEEKNEYIKKNPAYGKIICRCETVTEGEIRDAIRRDPKPQDIDGVKRRTRSGMGRCQGGFCKPFVMKLLAEENGCKMEDVTKNGKTSQMVLGKL
ncbi:MAG: FAD-dependent oxidoreductase [Clostridia bacterium]|nr:FAD-dependent oxidoreductase [Clostridia bacterium]